jgi:hypothetical protein
MTGDENVTLAIELSLHAVRGLLPLETLIRRKHEEHAPGKHWFRAAAEQRDP